MSRLAVQTHTLRTLDESIEEKLDRIADAGYEGAQFTPALGDRSPEDLAEAVEERGLEVAGLHVDRERLEDEYEAALEDYRALGTTDLVISTYHRENYESEEGIAEAADHLGGLADRLAEDGFTLHYHNHYFEFTDLDGRSGFEAFADATEGSLRLEVDTGLAYHGDADPAALIEQYADRITLLHLTDTIPGSNETAHTELHEGEVDLQSCIDAAVEADVEWIIYENGRTDDPAASIVDAAEKIEAMLDA